jgi:fructose/tagatose bisphosphate aldolase
LHIQQFQLPFAMHLDHGEMSIGHGQAVQKEK